MMINVIILIIIMQYCTFYLILLSIFFPTFGESSANVATALWEGEGVFWGEGGGMSLGYERDECHRL